MATTVIGALSVEITADTKGVKKGIKSTGEALGVLGKKVRKNANAWAKWGAAAAAAAAVTAAALIKTSLSGIKELRNLAAAGNVTVTEFQRMAFGAEQFGISQEKMGDILKDFTERVGEFNSIGAGPMVDFFEQIAPRVGLAQDAFKDLSGKEGLQLYVDSLEKANLSQEEMTFFMETIASDSVRLLPLLRNNGKAMTEFAQAAEDLGIGLSDIDVAKAIEAEKTLSALATVAENQLMIIAAELSPLITAIGEEFLGAAKKGNEFARGVFEGVVQLGRAFAVLGDGIQGIKFILKGLELVARAVVAAITLAFAGLIKILDDTINTILEGWRLLFKEMESLVRPLNDGMADMFKGVADGINGLKLEGAGFFQEFANAQVEALKITKAELDAIAAEPLSTQQFDEFVERVREKAKVMAKEVKAGLTGGTVTDDPTEKVDKRTKAEINEAERIRLETERILEALLEQGLMREETLLGRLIREQDILDKAFADKLITQEEFNRASEALDEKAASVKIGILTSSLDAVATALSVGGKKTQKIAQKIAIARALISGGEAAVHAWDAGMSTGGPWAPIVAAAYTAASLAKTGALISSIRSGSKSSSGGGGTLPSASTPSTAPGGGGQQQPQQQRIFNVTLQGTSIGPEVIRQMIEGFDEQIGDGVQFNVTGA